MTAPHRLRLAPEFGCWPLWDDATGDTLEPDAWPLPPELAARLTAWDEVFQATLDPAYPPDSRFPSPAAEAAWRAEGQAIAHAIEAHIGATRLVVRF